jgi:membrane-associated phospholipid phosphatase
MRSLRGPILTPDIDLPLLLKLNSMVPAHSESATFWDFFGNNPLFRGFPVFFSVVALWFWSDNIARRSRMLIGLLSTCVAVVLSVQLQHHLHIHTRPFLDTTLHLQSTPNPLAVGLTNLNSFPSDTATLFFSLSMVVFLERRRAGCVVFLWALFTAGIARVVTGWHYPSDVVGSFVLGPSCVYFMTRIRPLRAYFERLLERWEPRVYIVDGLLFLFLADAYVSFSGLQSFFVVFGKFGAYLIKEL